MIDNNTCLLRKHVLLTNYFNNLDWHTFYARSKILSNFELMHKHFIIYNVLIFTAFFLILPVDVLKSRNSHKHI